MRVLFLKFILGELEIYYEKTKDNYFRILKENTVFEKDKVLVERPSNRNLIQLIQSKNKRHLNCHIGNSSADNSPRLKGHLQALLILTCLLSGAIVGTLTTFVKITSDL